jgi:virulence factor Mce-like protein
MTRRTDHSAPAGLRRRVAAALVSALSCVLVLSGCSVYDVPLPGGADTGENPMTLKVMFRDVLDLVPQSTVKVDDVTVGKVTEVDLKGYVAEVTVEVPRDIDLPDNARAEIRQTSLLGEKFVELGAPQEPSSGKLSDNDVIGLDRTSRNAEVEEVFSALALLLNGGGVGQLKTIVSELNNTFEGREDEVRSVLNQIRSFMTQLDQNKESIVAAIENTSRLAVEIQKQDGAIKSALDDVPDALRSVNRQRDDLVKLLEALERLSGVGVRVIRASKESTINTLRDLGPVLEGFARAGKNFPESFQVFLTYPFVDAAVGRDPQVARNLHMGDYTNLSVDLDINVADLPKLPAPPAEVCELLDQIERQVRNGAEQAADGVVDPLEEAGLPAESADRLRRELQRRIVDRFLDQLQDQCQQPDPNALARFAERQLNDAINDLGLRNLVERLGLEDTIDGILGTVTGGGGGGGGGNGGDGGGDGGVTDGLGLPRVDPGQAYQAPEPIDPFGLVDLGLDPGLGTMLLQGVAEVR